MNIGEFTYGIIIQYLKIILNGNYRVIYGEDIEGVDTTIISGWFAAVPDEPVSIT